MVRNGVRAALLLLVLLLAPAFQVGAFALSGTDPLLHANLDRADFEFQYVPQANSDYAIYLFSADGNPVQGRVDVFENSEVIVSGEGAGEICSAWLVKDVSYTVRVHGSGNAMIEVARKALSRSFAQPLQAEEGVISEKVIAHAYDAHWYSFDAVESGEMLLTCVPEEAGLQLQALLLDDRGALLAQFENLTGGAARLLHETRANQRYFIRISAPDGGLGYYALGLHRDDGQAPPMAFDTAELVLAAGSEIDLAAELGEGALLWVSDHPEVAMVDGDGIVYALNAGEAVITAYGIRDQADIRLRVEFVPLEGLEIIGEQLRLNVGDDADIQIEMFPEYASDQRLRFQVEDTGVASVSREGVLRAIMPGETVLRVFNADGSIGDSIPVIVEPAIRKYRALLVGEQSYPFAQDSMRDGSDNSVRAIASLLGTVEFEEAAYSVRTRRDLSRAELIAEIRKTFQNATAQDVSLLYITCHGSYTAGMSFLELSDGSTLSARDLERELRKISGTVVVLIDSCGSGGTIGGASDRAAFAKGVTAAFSEGSLRGSRYKVIASAGLDEDSFRIAFNDRAAAGTMATVFARALCDGAGWNIDLNAPGNMSADRDYDGRITLGELQEYMADRVNWYLDLASELTGEDYRQSIQVYPEGDPLVLFERRS